MDFAVDIFNQHGNNDNWVVYKIREAGTNGYEYRAGNEEYNCYASEWLIAIYSCMVGHDL